MPVYTGLAVLGIGIDSEDYAESAEDFEVTIENQTEDGSGLSQRWEAPVGVKSRWHGQGNIKVTDTVDSLLVKAASNDIEVPFALDTGLETVTGTVLLTSVGRQMRNGAIQMVPVSIQGVGEPTVTPT